MTRKLTSLPLVGVGALGLCAASVPSVPTVLSQVQPGIWEINGVPGAAYPLPQCVPDIAVLARFEHRGQTCTANLVRNSGAVAVINYRCGPAGFGNSEITVLTPRSIKISTQGISDGLPFNYVLQAHRVGDCAPAPRH